MKVSHRLKSLFTSQTRSKLIAIFFSHITELYYVRELVRLTGEEINSVRRELENMKTSGLISSEARGNRLYYWANRDHFLAYQLQILASQQMPPFSEIIENKAKIGSLKYILVSQEFLNGASSNGLDMILVGDIALKFIEDIIKKEETSRQTEINYMVMDKEEFHIRQLKRDPILIQFLTNLPAIIYGQPGL
jgi:hypothetical protein